MDFFSQTQVLWTINPTPPEFQRPPLGMLWIWLTEDKKNSHPYHSLQSICSIFLLSRRPTSDASVVVLLALVGSHSSSSFVIPWRASFARTSSLLLLHGASRLMVPDTPGPLFTALAFGITAISVSQVMTHRIFPHSPSTFRAPILYRRCITCGVGTGSLRYSTSQS